MLFNLFAGIIGFIGRRTFWRISKKDEIYLKNFYNRLASIDGDTEFAKKQTDLERKKIVSMREANFWGRLSNLFS